MIWSEMWFTRLPPRWDGVLPRFFTEPEYAANEENGTPGAEEELANFLHGVLFYKEWDGKEESLDSISARARANAEIATKTAIATRTLAGTMERSFDFQIHRINSDGLYAYVEGEYETLQEFLSGRLSNLLLRIKEGDLKPTNGEVSDLLYLIQVLFPRLQAHKVKIEDIISVTGNYSKLRAIVAPLKRAEQIFQLEAANVTDELKNQAQAEAEDKFTHEATRLLELVANKEITPARMASAIRQEPLVPKIPGNVFFLPEETVYVIRAPVQLYGSMIEYALASVVSNWEITDAQALYREITETKSR